MPHQNDRRCLRLTRHVLRLVSGVVVAVALLVPAALVGTGLASGQGRPAIVGGVVTTRPASAVPTTRVTAAKPTTTTSTTVPPAPVKPNPGIPVLLKALVSDERQMTSLTAYADSQAYLREAQTQLVVAGDQVAAALVVWGASVAREQTAVGMQTVAERTVDLYQEALYQLGLAEYTGQTEQSGSDLQALETQVERSQLGDVAAGDTANGLSRAETALAKASWQVRAAQDVVAARWSGVWHAKHALAVAQAQVETSRRALVRAHQWATVSGQAPAQPALALARLEGALVPRTGSDDAADNVSPPGSGGPGTAVAPTGPGAAAGDVSDAATGAAGVASVAPTGVAGAGTGITTVAATGVAGAVTASPTTVVATVAPTTVVAVPTATGPTTTTPTTSMPTTPTGAHGRSGATPPVVTTVPHWATGGPTILGPSLLTAAQIEGWFASSGAVANTTVPIDKLIADYIKAGRLTGVRADVAFAQSVIETGYFSFPAFGQDPSKYNNFAGIGACDSCKHGFKFPSATGGVIAQQDLLSNYATPSEMASGPEGSSDNLGVAGCCQTWMALSGVWATNPNYGFEILTVYKEMFDWALRQELHQVGLAPGTTAVMGVGAANQPGKSEPTPSHSPQT